MSKLLIFYLSLTALSHFPSDSDPRLSTALYQTWSSDPRIYKSPALPELFPLLFDKLHNPSVTAFLREVVPHIVPQLVLRRRLDIIVKALTQSVYSYSHLASHWQFYLGLLMSMSFKYFCKRPVLELKTVMGMRRIGLLLSRSLFKSWGSIWGAVMRLRVAMLPLLSTFSLKVHNCVREGSWTKVLVRTYRGSHCKLYFYFWGLHNSIRSRNGEMRAQQSSLDALYSLFMAAPDHADRLVIDSLPNLRDILRQDGLVVDVYEKALYLLLEIVKQSPHSVIIRSDIVVDFVRWLRQVWSPAHVYL